jgi:hypothetical protein
MRARWIVQQITHNWKNEEDMTRKLTTLFAAAAVLSGALPPQRRCSATKLLLRPSRLEPKARRVA